MAMQNNFIARVDTSDETTRPLEYAEIADVDVRIALQRCEDRILSYTQDMTDSLIAMAGEFRKAKEALAKAGRGGQWARWVKRFPGISYSTADNLARLGELEQSELASLRSGLFAKSGGIAGIAAYLNAPAPVQEQVQKGEVEPKLHDIREAARAFKEAEEAQKRAVEAERRAREAEANVEAKIRDAVTQARLQGQLELQQVTAALQREVDEARHKADMRQREMLEAQQQIQRAEGEYKQRIAQATASATQQERERLEREYTSDMRALQKQLEDTKRAAQTARKEADELNERLTHSRDSDAIRARWDALAVHLIDTIDAAMVKLPSVMEAQYFENHERTLVESLRKRAEAIQAKMAELSRGSMTVVDSRP